MKKFILTGLLVLLSFLSINKLNALTYTSYLRLNNSDNFLNPGYVIGVSPNTSTTLVSGYHLDGTGGLAYYITTTLKICGTGSLELSVSDEDKTFLISKSIKNLGSCKVNGYNGSLYEIEWVRYLPVVNGSDAAVSSIFVKTAKLPFALYYNFISTSATVQTAQIYEQQQSNQKIEDVNSSINNENIDGDNTSNKINEFKDLTAENGVITNLVTLPVTLYSSVVTGLTGTCKPFSLGDLFGTDLSMPCVNLQTYLGSALWGIIDVLLSGMLVYVISKKFIKLFDNMSSLKDGDIID